MQSRIDLAIALAEAGGDTVEVANLQLAKARQALAFILKTSPKDEQAVNQARAEVASATRAQQDAVLNKQQSDIEFALEMGRITTGQAIESYRMLLQIPTNTEEQNRELELTIRRLQESLRQDFQFNLPTGIYPTAYEVRRVAQGEGGYQDNRVISVTVNAGTNATPESIAQAVAVVVGEPNRSGIRPSRY
jgi:hypothetical protein